MDGWVGGPFTLPKKNNPTEQRSKQASKRKGQGDLAWHEEDEYILTHTWSICFGLAYRKSINQSYPFLSYFTYLFPTPPRPTTRPQKSQYTLSSSSSLRIYSTHSIHPSTHHIEMNQNPNGRKKERKKERKKKTLHKETETEEEQEQKRSAKIQVSHVRGGGDGALFCFLSCFAGGFSKGREGIGKGRDREGKV